MSTEFPVVRYTHQVHAHERTMKSDLSSIYYANAPFYGLVFAVLTLQPALQVAAAHDHQKRHQRNDNGARMQLSGYGNNRRQPFLGASNTAYARVAPAQYADGIGQMVSGPQLRYVSNRVFAR